MQLGNTEMAMVHHTYINNNTIDDVMAFAHRSGAPTSKVYDRVIRALGFNHNTSACASATPPQSSSVLCFFCVWDQGQSL